MNNAISVADWLGHMDREYLSTFIKDGGASVKFAIVSQENVQALREALRSRCEELGYVFVTLDALARRVHMPQDIFFGLASQIDWRVLARRLILRLLAEEGYRVEGIDARDAVNVIDNIARANHLETQFVLTDLRPRLQDKVFRDPGMAKAFRVAMTHLCLKEMEQAGSGEYAGQPLLDWLTGVDTRIGNVRPFQVYTPVNRTTARYFIESALYWVRHAGYSGTVILLDNARVTVSRNPRDGGRYYTRAMTTDHYEVLREFIDDADRLPGSLLVVASDEAFVDEHSPRGWGMYAALRTRVMDDVRDRKVVNPVAALVRLS